MNPKINIKANGKCVKAHIITDFRTYGLFNNSSTDVISYVNGFWGSLETLNDKEIIPIELKEITVYDADDPFNV